MGKKANTLYFMVIATLVNVLILAACFGVGFLILSLLVRYIPYLQSEESSFVWMLLILFLFIGAIAGGFMIYNKIVMWASRKWNLEDKLHPIFSSRKQPKKQ